MTTAELMIHTLMRLVKNKERIEKVLENDLTGATFESLTQRVLHGQLRPYFLDNDGLILMEIVDQPRARCLHIWMAVGDVGCLKDVLDVHPILAKMARDNGCEYATLTGRPGWTKHLTERGWQQTAIQFYLPLGAEIHDWEHEDFGVPEDKEVA